MAEVTDADRREARKFRESFDDMLGGPMFACSSQGEALEEITTSLEQHLAALLRRVREREREQTEATACKWAFGIIEKWLERATAKPPPGPPSLPSHIERKRGRIEVLRELQALFAAAAIRSQPAEKEDELLALAEQATPGPWITVGGSYRHTVVRKGPRATPDLWIADLFGAGRGRANAQSNAAFIAACSPTVVRGLIERAQKAERDRDEWREAANDYPALAARMQQAEAACGTLRLALEDIRGNRTCSCYHAGVGGPCERCKLGYDEAVAALASGAGERAAAVLARAKEFADAAKEADINNCAADSDRTDAYESGARTALRAAVDAWRARTT